MPGFQAPLGGTIPPHVIVTNLHPNLFILDEVKCKVVVLELTCPWDADIVLITIKRKSTPLWLQTCHGILEPFISPSRTQPGDKLLLGVASDLKRNAGQLNMKISKVALLASYSLFLLIGSLRGRVLTH